MKLDVNVLRYLSREDFRVLTAVEMGQKNVRRAGVALGPGGSWLLLPARHCLRCLTPAWNCRPTPPPVSATPAAARDRARHARRHHRGPQVSSRLYRRRCRCRCCCGRWRRAADSHVTLLTLPPTPLPAHPPPAHPGTAAPSSASSTCCATSWCTTTTPSEHSLRAAAAAAPAAAAAAALPLPPLPAASCWARQWGERSEADLHTSPECARECPSVNLPGPPCPPLAPTSPPQVRRLPPDLPGLRLFGHQGAGQPGGHRGGGAPGATHAGGQQGGAGQAGAAGAASTGAAWSRAGCSMCMR